MAFCDAKHATAQCATRQSRAPQSLRPVEFDSTKIEADGFLLSTVSGFRMVIRPSSLQPYSRRLFCPRGQEIQCGRRVGYCGALAS